MVVCAIKVCRNYKGRINTTKKVTYHRIPNDPVMRNRWTKVIRKCRGDDLWKPTKATVVCSDHFYNKDLYIVNEQGRRRLKKEAVPSKALFLSSIKSDESDNSDEDVGSICDVEIKQPTSEFSEAGPSGISKNAEQVCTSTETAETLTPVNNTETSTSIGCSTPNEIVKNEVDIEEEIFSDVDSVLDSPGKAKLRLELHRKTELQKKHTSIIQSLRRKNQRLEKKITSLKQIILTLKKNHQRSQTQPPRAPYNDTDSLETRPPRASYNDTDSLETRPPRAPNNDTDPLETRPPRAACNDTDPLELESD